MIVIFCFANLRKVQFKKSIQVLIIYQFRKQNLLIIGFDQRLFLSKNQLLF